MLACLVEKPPVEVVVNAWFMASKKLNPRHIKITVSKAVKEK